MTSPWILIAALLALGTIYVVVPVMGRAYVRYRGRRVITCPETKAPAAVEVNAVQAALDSIAGSPEPRLQDCSRWPERQACGQECLSQIEDAPDGCLVASLVRGWYAGKECVLCRKGIGDLHWYDRRPALIDAAGRTVQWDDVPAQNLPDLLRTHRPVCWSCHVAETFRREHPDLVVDRPWRPGSPAPRGRTKGSPPPVH
jgi:hypothetical protein